MRALAPEQPLEIFCRVVWERYSDWNKEPSHIRRKVRRMYGGLKEEVSRHEELEII